MVYIVCELFVLILKLHFIDPGKCSGISMNLESRIMAQFESNMINGDVPLLRRFEFYANHLPVRECLSIFQLYKLDYFTHSKDLSNMADRIISRPAEARNYISYITAPSGSGKTASVLPVFLESTKNMKNGGTHYFYMAFTNNNGRHFQLFNSLALSACTVVAEWQGAAFIFE